MDGLTAIEERVLSHPILRHPFLEQLRRGEFTKAQVATWVSQQFYFSNQFPRCLAAVYAKIEDFALSRPLVAFLAIEHWGSDVSGAHWRKFVTVLGAFGYEVGVLRLTPPFPETADYLDFRLGVCLHRSVEEALGAMGYGHELINESIFTAYLEGIERVTGIPDQALDYFRSHVQDEPEDYAIFKRIMAAYAETEAGLDLIAKGAEDVLAARYRFFDRTLERATGTRRG